MSHTKCFLQTLFKCATNCHHLHQYNTAVLVTNSMKGERHTVGDGVTDVWNRNVPDRHTGDLCDTD